MEEGRSVEEKKKKGIETAGFANCNQGNGEMWEEETRGEQKDRKGEEDIPLVRLCDSGTWPARTFLIFKHLSDLSSRELSFSKQ